MRINVPVKTSLKFLQHRGKITGKQRREVAETGFPNVQEAVLRTAKYAQNYWAEAAMGKHFDGAFRFKRRYAEAILADSALKYPFQNNRLRARIRPVQKYARMAEFPIASFDMKEHILAGPNAARFDKDGNKYKNIPFRHGEDLNPWVREYMQEQEETVSVYRFKRRIKDDEGNLKSIMKQFNTRWGYKLNHDDIDANLPISEREKQRVLGMYRVKHIYKKAIENQMMTWRYLGHKSDPFAWIHPGFPANPILERIVPHITEVFKREVLEGLMKDLHSTLKGGRM